MGEGEEGGAKTRGELAFKLALHAPWLHRTACPAPCAAVSAVGGEGYWSSLCQWGAHPPFLQTGTAQVDAKAEKQAGAILHQEPIFKRLFLN